jgi:site-specific DNA recombinase
MRAALYVRVSSEEQRKGWSLAGQHHDLREYCAKQGYRVVRRYQEVDSGMNPDRPLLHLLLDHAADRRFDVVVVWKRDRWGRHPVYNGLFEEHLRRCDVRLEAMDTGRRQATDETELFDGLLDLLNRYESRRTARRCQMGRLQAAREGIWPTKPPWGYRRNPATQRLELEPAEAAQVRSVLEQAALGVSLHGIAKRTQMPYARIQAWLWNPAYEGRLVYCGVEVAGAWPAMVPRDVLERAREGAKRRHIEKGGPRRSA